MLIVLAYNGLSAFPAAIICALVVIVSNGMPIWDSLTTFFMAGFNSFVGAYLLMFAASTLFAKAIEESGAARSIAYAFLKLFGRKQVVWVIAITAAALTYGGVSLFVVIFALYPICIVLMKEANIAKRLLPGILCIGAATFTMTAMPGTPQLTNVIPSQLLGTPLTAGALMGIIASAIMLLLGVFYMQREVKLSMAAGETFVPGPNDDMSKFEAVDESKLPSKVLSFIPLVFILLAMVLGSLLPVFKGKATMLVVIAMIIATIMVYIFNWKRLAGKRKSIINQGLTSAIPAIGTVAVIIGFGAVVQNSPAFQSFVAFALSLPFSPYISSVIAVNLVAGITGSSSGGMQIFIKALGEQYVAMGADPAILHRLTAIAAGGLDTLPHCGGIFILLGALGLTHKQSYKQIFVVSVAIPIIATIVCTIMAVAFY